MPALMDSGILEVKNDAYQTIRKEKESVDGLVKTQSTAVGELNIHEPFRKTFTFSMINCVF